MDDQGDDLQYHSVPGAQSLGLAHASWLLGLEVFLVLLSTPFVEPVDHGWLEEFGSKLEPLMSRAWTDFVLSRQNHSQLQTKQCS